MAYSGLYKMVQVLEIDYPLGSYPSKKLKLGVDAKSRPQPESFLMGCFHNPCMKYDNKR